MLVGGLSACKSKKKQAEAEAAKPPGGETEIKVLCSGPEFFTDDKVFRANNLGESMDQATSKKKAMANARADLASAIQTRIKGVIRNWRSSGGSFAAIAKRLYREHGICGTDNLPLITSTIRGICAQ